MLCSFAEYYCMLLQLVLTNLAAVVSLYVISVIYIVGLYYDNSIV